MQVKYVVLADESLCVTIDRPGQLRTAKAIGKQPWEFSRTPAPRAVK